MYVAQCKVVTTYIGARKHTHMMFSEVCIEGNFGGDKDFLSTKSTYSFCHRQSFPPLEQSILSQYQ